MNRFVPAIFILAVCSSCSIYQYNTLSSDIGEPFIFENDTVRVRYSFGDGNVNLEIFNKAARPLYVDWSRSSLIIDGDPAPYLNVTPVSFIPPVSGLNNSPTRLPSIVNDTFSTDLKEYADGYSPLTFRSFLFLSLDQDFNEQFTLDHMFWISSSYQSKEPIRNSGKQNGYISSKLTEGGEAGSAIFGVLLAVPVAWFYVNLNSE
jgi:hypothetical protein